ncbi:hypothetical protein Tco_0176206 [Tanacetum coccineum]
MKSIKDQVNARTIEFKSDNEIIAEVTKSTNQDHESGVDRRLPVGTGSSSRTSLETKIIEHGSKLQRSLGKRLRIKKGSSRIPNDDEDGDDQDGNDEDDNANNEDGNGSDESLSESDDE